MILNMLMISPHNFLQITLHLFGSLAMNFLSKFLIDYINYVFNACLYQIIYFNTFKNN